MKAQTGTESIARLFALLSGGAKEWSEIDYGRISWEDICGAAQGLPRFNWNLACMLWAGWDHVAGEVLAEIEHIALIQGWDRKRRERAAQLVLYEIIGVACEACSGSGEIVNENGVRLECPICHGQSSVGMKDADRAAFVRVSKAAWKQHWKERYTVLYERVRRDLDRTVAHMQRRLPWPRFLKG